MRVPDYVIGGLLALAVGAAAAGPAGLKPRASATDYAAHAEQAKFALGAALLTPEQVRHSFASDLSRDYLVLEVGVYPKEGQRLDIGPGDFLLRVAGTQTATRPASPRAIASILQKSNASGRDITLYPSVGVGYESGRLYDPATGTRRAGGVSTSAGVGVGVGDSRPASTDKDRKTMEMELGEQQLPEQVVTKPVAGYLYFPVPTKKKGAAYELEYAGPAGKVVLSFPPPNPAERER